MLVTFLAEIDFVCLDVRPFVVLAKDSLGLQLFHVPSSRHF
jgi:hypothetical protein